jgi:hypothetical protein
MPSSIHNDVQEFRLGYRPSEGFTPSAATYSAFKVLSGFYPVCLSGASDGLSGVSGFVCPAHFISDSIVAVL